MNPRYRDTQLKLIGISFLSCLGSLTLIKRVRSYPSVVRILQMDELTSSLGVPEPRYILEIMKQLHIDLWGKVIENLGG